MKPTENMAMDTFLDLLGSHLGNDESAEPKQSPKELAQAVCFLYRLKAYGPH
uniref:Uncharacterized protein n=1 Tax=Anguilla anguilla TaxID=7936 RepID=A0A0E9RLZ0_ANGAN